MSVNNVNTNNNIVKLALQKKGTKKAEALKPEWAKMTGSIFSAPKLQQTTENQRVNLAELNAKKSLNELNQRPKEEKTSPKDDFSNVSSVSGGKAAISKANSIKSKVSAYTSQTKNNTKTINKYSSEQVKLASSIEKDDKTFQAQLKKDQTELKKDQQKLQKIVQETEERSKQINDAQNELDSLSSSNENGKNSSRIKELHAYIGSQVSLNQRNGKTIYSLQRNQTRTLSRMNRINARYINTQKANSKATQQLESKNNGLLKTATDVEQYSAMAEAGGQALGIAGQALIALGQSSLLGSGGFSAALIAIGEVMQKTGSVVKLVGQYGQAAANITKTAAYIADDNIMGAMMSIAAAAKSGMSAAQSTKQIGAEWKNIDKQATAATQKMEAKAAAKEFVKENGAIDGLSEKETRKAIEANLRNQMNDGTIKTEGKWAGTQLKNLKKELSDNTKATLKDGTTTTTFVKKAFETEKDKLSDTIKTVAKDNKITYADSDFSQDNKTTFKTEDNKVISNKTIKAQIKKSFKNHINDLTKDIPKVSASFGDNISKLGSSVTNIAAIFMQNQVAQNVGNYNKKPISQLHMDARTRKIMERNQRYRTMASLR